MILAPLDWGLGHATRCIPLIRGFLAAGCDVLVGAEGAQAHLLRKEFPGIVVLPLPGYRVRYSRYRWTLPFTLALQLPQLLRTIRAERKWLAEMVAVHRPDLVVSDNRYGFYSTEVRSIFITHQLTVKAPFPWAERIIRSCLYRYIRHFDVCWVPDAAGTDNLAGELSHPPMLPAVPVRYIGLLSRFTRKETAKLYDYCILLSGPEPQRTILERKILEEAAALNARILLVRGKPGSEEAIAAPAHIEVRNHLPGEALQEAILQSEYIVCRSGYTTLMEVLSLGKKAILIPTPGQTEQEYLAQKLHNEEVCLRVPQHHPALAAALESAKRFPFRARTFDTFDASGLAQWLDP